MNWLINASVWIQAPVVVAFLLAFAGVASWLLNKALWTVMPRDAEETHILGPESLSVLAEDARRAAGEAPGAPEADTAPGISGSDSAAAVAPEGGTGASTGADAGAGSDGRGSEEEKV